MEYGLLPEYSNKFDFSQNRLASTPYKRAVVCGDTI